MFLTAGGGPTEAVTSLVWFLPHRRNDITKFPHGRGLAGTPDDARAETQCAHYLLRTTLRQQKNNEFDQKTLIII